MTMIVSILITSICVWLAYVLLCRRYFPVNEQVATYPGKWPLIGHVYKFTSSIESFQNIIAFGEHSVKIGDVIKVYLGPLPIHVVTDPEDVATVLNKCLDKLFVYKYVKPMVGDRLLIAEVPIWKRNRRVLDLCFKQHILDDYLQLFNERAERFVETIAEYVGQGEVDLKKKISRSVLETTCRTTLGINRDGKNDINDNYAIAINDCLDTLSDRIYKPWLIVDAVFNLSSDKKKLDKALETIFEFSEKTILLRKAERIQCLQKNEDFNHKGGFKSVLDVILENTVTETKSALTDTQLRNLMDNMLLAAFDTTIYQMNLVLVCIGSSSEVQDKILQEMNLILGKDRRLKSDNLSQLVYLDAVVKEAIRLYPVGPLVGRTTTTHTKLRNVTIPAGSSVVVHILVRELATSEKQAFQEGQFLDILCLSVSQTSYGLSGTW